MRACCICGGPDAVEDCHECERPVCLKDSCSDTDLAPGDARHTRTYCTECMEKR